MISKKDFLKTKDKKHKTWKIDEFTKVLYEKKEYKQKEKVQTCRSYF